MEAIWKGRLGFIDYPPRGFKKLKADDGGMGATVGSFKQLRAEAVFEIA